MPKLATFFSLTIAVAASCGTGCPPSTPGGGGTLGHQVFTIQQGVGWRREDGLGPNGPNQSLTFQPTQAGKRIDIMITTDAPQVRTSGRVYEGFTLLAAVDVPTTSTTQLSFDSQNTNVHQLNLYFSGHGEIGSRLTVDITQQN